MSDSTRDPLGAGGHLHGLVHELIANSQARPKSSYVVAWYSWQQPSGETG